MLLVAIKLDLFVDSMHLSIHPHPGKAIRVKVTEELPVGSFLLADDWREDGDCRSGFLAGVCTDAVGDLIGRLGLYPDGVSRAVRHSDAGKEQPQVVVDLGDRSHGAPWILGGRLLLNGDGRGEPFDAVDVRLVHLPQELAGVGG
ncbi:Uncharacterised protein [uncultured archaeon]|nr:Uncharacterised protein [uncultured archaeon]